ncbi:MAG: hypothetical protein Q4D85_08145 [Corynebacterium sp.]|uniref:hypothetical protein n=1 Tax=Corynebacterium sp. TaxID=1720 RepID=UPI0026DCA583|nr:hypothetical protein [Corynebacterium sp.]MDO5098717.1 hypothetical protein [Corynebacterium sp.]
MAACIRGHWLRHRPGSKDDPISPITIDEITCTAVGIAGIDTVPNAINADMEAERHREATKTARRAEPTAQRQGLHAVGERSYRRLSLLGVTIGVVPQFICSNNFRKFFYLSKEACSVCAQSAFRTRRYDMGTTRDDL